MAQNKRKLFPPRELTLADFAKALSHPARVQILRVLATRQPCICNDLVEALPLSQPSVSQHLDELKKAKLVTVEINGAKFFYRVNWPMFNDLSTRFGDFAQDLGQFSPR
jgi:DNA-binding transcriptional ArsR family regulator